MIDLNKIKEEKSIKELINFGIINLDKSPKFTSFDMVDQIRRLLNLKKCGHGGTLDPLVTGVLPILLGKACKIQEYFMHRDKTYIGVMKLHQEVSKKQLESEMKKFLGVINQLPPRISRVKRVLRKRKIMEFKIIKFDKDKREAEFISKVEAGTYIRKLIDDLGKQIGGAQMIKLRRLEAGIFSEKDKEFCTIDEFKEAVSDYKNGKEAKLRKLIIPAEIISKLLPIIKVKDDEDILKRLKNGSPIFLNMFEEKDKNKYIKLINQKEPFLIIWKNTLVEVAKFSEHFKNKEIIAKAEVVI